MLSCRHVIMLSCHHVIRIVSSCHHVIVSSCHHQVIIMSSCHQAIIPLFSTLRLTNTQHKHFHVCFADRQIEHYFSVHCVSPTTVSLKTWLILGLVDTWHSKVPASVAFVNFSFNVFCPRLKCYFLAIVYNFNDKIYKMRRKTKMKIILISKFP